MPDDGRQTDERRGREAAIRVIVLTAAFAVVVLLLVLPLPHAWRSTWRSKLLDLGHIPLFAVLTLALHRMLRLSLGLTFMIAAATAAACEVAQAAASRAANTADFLRGVIGSLLAIILIRSCRPPLRTTALASNAILALLLLAWPFAEATPRLWDAVQAHRSFPILCDFQTKWQSHRWYKDRASIRRVLLQPAGPWVGEVEFYPNGSNHAAIILFPTHHDWSPFESLVCDISIPKTVDLLVSVRDGRRVTGNRKRFDLARQYPPGDHRIQIDLPPLARDGPYSPLDLTRIESFHLVVRYMEKPTTLIVRRIWLE